MAAPTPRNGRADAADAVAPTPRNGRADAAVAVAPTPRGAHPRPARHRLEEVAKLEDRTLLSMIQPAQNEALVERLQAQGATAFAMDCIPRLLSRGQAFDVLSSQANLAGFRAIIEASHAYGRTMAGSMTAAGKLAPAEAKHRLQCLQSTRVMHTSIHTRIITYAYIVLFKPFASFTVSSCAGVACF